MFIPGMRRTSRKTPDLSNLVLFGDLKHYLQNRWLLQEKKDEIKMSQHIYLSKYYQEKKDLSSPKVKDLVFFFVSCSLDLKVRTSNWLCDMISEYLLTK